MRTKENHPDTVTGQDGLNRCWWAGLDPEYQRYHDEEWGRPVHDDQKLFEKLCLEGFQAGLSWLTILKKRKAFRTAFDHFDPVIMANYNQDKIKELLDNASIIMNKAKINACIANARILPDIIKTYGSFSSYVWSFKPKPDERPKMKDRKTLHALSSVPSSHALSRDLKKKGFKFVGPTIIYAFMQSVGMINDHVTTCHCHDEVEALKR